MVPDSDEDIIVLRLRIPDLEDAPKWTYEPGNTGRTRFISRWASWAEQEKVHPDGLLHSLHLTAGNPGAMNSYGAGLQLELFFNWSIVDVHCYILWVYNIVIHSS